MENINDKSIKNNLNDDKLKSKNVEAKIIWKYKNINISLIGKNIKKK